MYEHCLGALEILCTNCWHLESQNKYLDQFISLLWFERFFSENGLILHFLSEDEINDGYPGLIALSEGSTQYSWKAHILSSQLGMVTH